MSLTVETGTGVQGAESYAAIAFIDAYWANRTHNALAATWTNESDEAKKEGAAREASGYIDATWGPYFRGVRRGYVQGLLWPRTDANDDAGYPLPDMPDCLMQAVAELAVRALSSALANDLDRGGDFKAIKAGSVQIDYADGASTDTRFGSVDNLLAPILNGSQPKAPNNRWSWA